MTIRRVRLTGRLFRIDFSTRRCWQFAYAILSVGGTSICMLVDFSKHSPHLHTLHFGCRFKVTGVCVCAPEAAHRDLFRTAPH